ncbi:hypothetical protein D3C72_815520 [compost metagenome]
MLVVALGAVPMKFDFDATVIIAVNLLAGRPGDAGGLANQRRSLRGQWRAIEHIPGNSAEAVAITLGKVIFRFAGAGD